MRDGAISSSVTLQKSKLVSNGVAVVTTDSVDENDELTSAKVELKFVVG